MKILFIKPPNWGFYHEIERYFPIGLAYLASACRQKGHDVKIFDSLSYTEDNRVLSRDELNKNQLKKVINHPVWENIIHWGASWERIKNVVKEYNPDVVAITIMHSPMYDTGYYTAKIVREIKPNVTIITGGAHPTIAYDHVLDELAFDYVLQGEGELSFPALIECLGKKAKPYNVDGVAFRDSEKNNKTTRNGIPIYVNEKKVWIHDLNSLAYPAVDLLDFSRYSDTAVILTSRGCPFSCGFCTIHPSVGNKYRKRTPENIVDEIQWYINNFGIRKFNIEDDNFTFDMPRSERMCDLIIERNLDIEWALPNGITVINLNEKIIDKMCKSGLKDLFLGLETTSSDRLNNMSKGFTSLQQVKQALFHFNERNLKMGASLIIGFPDQTIDDMINDIVTLIKEDIHFGTANPFYPLPGSRFYEEIVEEGILDPENDFTWYDEFNFPIESKNFSRKDIYELWIGCLAATPWPEILQMISTEYLSIESLAYIVNSKGANKQIELFDGGFYYTSLHGTSFSEIQQLNPNQDHGEYFVDKLTGDLMAVLAYLCTGIPYRSKQIESLLAGDSNVKFIIEEDNSSRSETLEKLSMALKSKK